MEGKSIDFAGNHYREVNKLVSELNNNDTANIFKELKAAIRTTAMRKNPELSDELNAYKDEAERLFASKYRSREFRV